MLHAPAPATGKSIQCLSHIRLLWSVGLFWAVPSALNTSLVLLLKAPLALQPLTLQFPTVQEPRASFQIQSGKRAVVLGVAVLLGRGTPEGPVPLLLGALRLWEKGLSWGLGYQGDHRRE